MAYYSLQKSLREKFNGKLLQEPSLLKKGVGTIALYINAPNSCHCLSQTPTFHESTLQCFESATFILHCIGKLIYICLCTCNWSKKKVWFLRCSNTTLLNTLNIPVSNKSTTIYAEESMFSNPPCQFSFQKFFPPEAMFIKACLEDMLRCVPVLSLV